MCFVLFLEQKLTAVLLLLNSLFIKVRIAITLKVLEERNNY